MTDSAKTCVMLHFLKVLGRRIITVEEGGEHVKRSAHLMEYMSDESALCLCLFLHDTIAGQQNFFFKSAVCVIADEAPVGRDV
jgi:hypothetical protein